MSIFVLDSLRGGEERQAQGEQGMVVATEGQRALIGDVLDGGALARGGEERKGSPHSVLVRRSLPVGHQRW